MNISPLYSTLFLTALLFWGLISFLRGSIRDRTTDAVFAIAHSNDAPQDDQLLKKVRDHFRQRAYRVVEIDPDRDVAVLTGQIQPSLFLAVFLSVLAALGLGCLGLVVGILITDLANLWLWLIPLAPIAGLFYWQGTARERQVSLRLLPESKLKVRAHKDEIEQLEKALQLVKVEE